MFADVEPRLCVACCGVLAAVVLIVLAYQLWSNRTNGD